jgi:hypothetical protein
MILYHFTAVERIDAIMKEGLTRGDVPTSTRGGRNGVWLTSDPEPVGHGVDEAAEMTEEDRNFVLEWRGILPPKGTKWQNKRAVRITVVVPTTDRKLVKWTTWGRRHCEQGMYECLLKAGGSKYDTWYVYFGIVEPSKFRAVDYLEGGPERPT